MTLTDTMPAPAVVSFAHLADLSLPFAPPLTASLDDAALLSAQRSVAQIRRRVDATAAALAAEIEQRSRRELGHAGLAQRLGARTPERLVQQLTGSTSREASTLVRVGALMVSSAPQSSGSDSAAEPDPHPWLREVGEAVAAGLLSLEAAEAIRGGLGAPDDAVSAESLTHAAATLLVEAPLSPSRSWRPAHASSEWVWIWTGSPNASSICGRSATCTCSCNRTA